MYRVVNRVWLPGYQSWADVPYHKGNTNDLEEAKRWEAECKASLSRIGLKTDKVKICEVDPEEK